MVGHSKDIRESEGRTHDDILDKNAITWLTKTALSGTGLFCSRLVAGGSE
jgi:hypothetical protein